LRGDTKSRFEAYTQARNSGWLNVDEIRQLEELPPLPDGQGQDYLQPLNMGPLGVNPLEDGGSDDE
jgi:phage portal protein BeeE